MDSWWNLGEWSGHRGSVCPDRWFAYPGQPETNGKKWDENPRKSARKLAFAPLARGHRTRDWVASNVTWFVHATGPHSLSVTWFAQ